MSLSGKWQLSFLLYVVCLSSSVLFVSTSISYNQYQYVGYRNTWHDGTAHQLITLPSYNGAQKKVEMVCANQCTLDVTCNGFYISMGSAASNCSLVRLSLETTKNLTYGNELGYFDRVYFVKSEITNQQISAMPSDLAGPCNSDTSAPISAAECASVSSTEINYFTCAASDNSYLATVKLVTDTRCSNENRLLQCNLLNGVVDSNINIATRFDKVNPAFIKYIYQNNGYQSAPSDEMTWMEGTLSQSPKNLTRIILRAIDPLVDRIKTGKITLTNQAGASATIPFTFPSINTCAVSFVFPISTIAGVKDAAATAKIFRVDILSKFSQAQANVGFKIDVFYR